MQDPPSTAVIQRLAQSVEDGASKLETRMIGAALELVARAAELGPASNAAEQARLISLLGESGDLHQLNRRLCGLIREGAASLATPGLAVHVRATTMEKLAIDQPAYAAYRRALEAE